MCTDEVLHGLGVAQITNPREEVSTKDHMNPREFADNQTKARSSARVSSDMAVDRSFFLVIILRSLASHIPYLSMLHLFMFLCNHLDV